jgi:S1-C subfamily serine protease
MKKMKRIWTLLLTAVLLVSLLPFRAAASEEEFPKVLAQAKKGVVQIYGLADDGFFLSSWVGTGFAVGEEGKDSDIFLTNWHVVANNGETPNAEIKLWILQENCPIDDRTLEPDPSLSITCKVLKTTTGYPDYAIIQATEPISGYEALPLLPSEEVLDGTKVYALGYPAVVGDASASHYGIDDITSTDGIVSQHMQYALADNTWVLMHTAKISGGNSGGPLINEFGEVIGINTMTMRDSQNLNFAICTQEIQNLIYGDRLTMEQFYEKCQKKNITLVLSHVNEQPMKVIKKAGFDKVIGEENFCAHIDDALALAEKLH